MVKLFKTGVWLVLISLAACKTTPLPPVVVPPVVPPAAGPSYVPSEWASLPDWAAMDLAPSHAAFLQGCRALKNKPVWQSSCEQAAQLDPADNVVLHRFFEQWFSPYQLINPDGSQQGMITGYYEPRLAGSRTRNKRFRYPVYGVPADLLEIDLTEVYPQLKGMRLRGRLDGRKVVPYYTRAELDNGHAPAGRELFWVDDAVALFFLQIQGSGRIELPDGSLVKIGYADQNGHPYVSIGKKLIEMGELKPEEASMQGIKQWGERNPDKLPGLLDQNPSYVFFRELPAGLSAPLGALGVPLTGEYSLAVDPRSIPLGAPVFLSTTRPNSGEPLNRLMMAQDTGGAIKGAIRADFFWGFGDEAGALAGKMKQQGRMWVLFLHGMEPAPVATGQLAAATPAH